MRRWAPRARLAQCRASSTASGHAQSALSSLLDRAVSLLRDEAPRPHTDTASHATAALVAVNALAACAAAPEATTRNALSSADTAAAVAVWREVSLIPGLLDRMTHEASTAAEAGWIVELGLLDEDATGRAVDWSSRDAAIALARTAFAFHSRACTDASETRRAALKTADRAVRQLTSRLIAVERLSNAAGRDAATKRTLAQGIERRAAGALCGLWHAAVVVPEAAMDYTTVRVMTVALLRTVSAPCSGDTSAAVAGDGAPAADAVDPAFREVRSILPKNIAAAVAAATPPWVPALAAARFGLVTAARVPHLERHKPTAVNDVRDALATTGTTRLQAYTAGATGAAWCRRWLDVCSMKPGDAGSAPWGALLRPGLLAAAGAAFDAEHAACLARRLEVRASKTWTESDAHAGDLVVEIPPDTRRFVATVLVATTTRGDGGGGSSGGVHDVESAVAVLSGARLLLHAYGLQATWGDAWGHGSPARPVAVTGPALARAAAGSSVASHAAAAAAGLGVVDAYLRRDMSIARCVEASQAYRGRCHDGGPTEVLPVAAAAPTADTTAQWRLRGIMAALLLRTDHRDAVLLQALLDDAALSMHPVVPAAVSAAVGKLQRDALAQWRGADATTSSGRSQKPQLVATPL